VEGPGGRRDKKTEIEDKKTQKEKMSKNNKIGREKIGKTICLILIELRERPLCH
jgi:hypothetical protein